MLSVPPIPSAEGLIETSFRAGKKAASLASTSKAKDRKLEAERRRISAVADKLCSKFEGVVRGFPSYEKLSRFHQRLLDLRIGKDKYKRSLAALKWCSTSVRRMKALYLRRLRGCEQPRSVSREFLGRAASFVKQVGKELEFLAEVRGVLLNFPVVKRVPTLVIAGYPNVGKSSFLRSLTGSRVEVASYPFTTKQIMLGYLELRGKTYQLVDTPGLLDRPMAKRNPIELQAVLALEELADKILFLIDPTVALEPQLSLLREVRKNFGKDVYVAITKVDLAGKALRQAEERLRREFGQRFLGSFVATRYEDCLRIFEQIFGNCTIW